MIQEIIAYRNIVNNIEDLINKSPLKKTTFILEAICLYSINES